MVKKCCLREISVFCDKESIFFTEKSNENETLYSGKRSAGQKKNSNKLSEFYSNINLLLLLLFPLISFSFFLMPTVPLLTLTVSYHIFSVHMLPPLAALNTFYLPVFLHVISCHKINSPIFERFTQCPIFSVVCESSLFA